MNSWSSHGTGTQRATAYRPWSSGRNSRMRPLGTCSATNSVPLVEIEIGPGRCRTGSIHLSIGISSEIAQRGRISETVQPAAKAGSGRPFLITRMRPPPRSDT